ncbi:MAG: hypothetical protein ACH349_06810 [Candidatus Rhabdochlamydia sp.]
MEIRPGTAQPNPRDIRPDVRIYGANQQPQPTGVKPSSYKRK